MESHPIGRYLCCSWIELILNIWTVMIIDQLLIHHIRALKRRR